MAKSIKKLIGIMLVLAMCLCAVPFSASAVDDEAKNLLAGASYTYQVGEFFSTFTDPSCTLLTNGKWRGDGETSFNGIYAVAGTTVELTGDTGATHINNVIVFTFEGENALDYLVFRGLRRAGNRYTNIASIETSSNGTAYTAVEFDEEQQVIAGAPTYDGGGQYYDVTTTFKQTATKVKYLKITLNTLDPYGARQYLVQMDEIEAYGSVTGKYTAAAEVSVSVDKAAVAPGETFTVTVLVNSITSPNGLVACDLPLIYDSSKLALTDVKGIYPSAWGGEGAVIKGNAASEPYWLRLVCDADDLAANSKYNVKKDGVMGFTLTFKAIATGETTVTVDNQAENGIFMMVVNGANFDNYGATGGSVSVNVSGEPIVSVKGDVNLDGLVDNQDAAFVLRYDAGLVDFDEGQLSRGDVNGDGYTDNTDAARILQYDAGLIPSV